MGTTLLVDIGNTRIKWACWRDGSLSAQRGAFHAGWHAQDFGRALARVRFESVLAVSVAPPQLEAAFSAAIAERGVAAPRFVRSQRGYAGVVNGYRDVWRLGADRWVAMIGAFHLNAKKMNTCLVDAGTAITIDLLDQHGKHHGGAIVPGPELMVRALLKDTGGIARRAAQLRPSAKSFRGARIELAGRTTRDGIYGGAWHAAAAIVERAARLAAERFRPLGTTQLLLTGGAAQVLSSLIDVPRARVQSDLVLRGLAVIADRADST